MDRRAEGERRRPDLAALNNRIASASSIQGYVPFADAKLYRQLDPEIRSLWKLLVDKAIYSPYQNLEWYENWLATVGKTKNELPFIIAVFDSSGVPSLIVPLVVVRHGLSVVARFPGGKHANYNFPIARRDIDITKVELQHLSDVLDYFGSDIDLYWLDTMQIQFDGKCNPLSLKRCYRHSEIISVVDLSGPSVGLPNVSFRHRSSYRKLLKIGALVERAVDPGVVQDTVNAFISQKSNWFQTRHLPDSFTQSDIIEFFLRLFPAKAPGELYLLRVHGEITAVAGVVVSSRRVSLMFVSYDVNHRLVKLGLGTHLIRSLIEHMDQRGFAQFDFGLGDTEYKRLLGARSEPLFLLVQATTLKGRVAARLLIVARLVKIYLKNSPRLFSAIQRLRRCIQSARQFSPFRALRRVGGG